MLAKSLSFLADADAAGIVLGARRSSLTSRADSVTTRLASCGRRLRRQGKRGRPARPSLDLRGLTLRSTDGNNESQITHHEARPLWLTRSSSERRFFEHQVLAFLVRGDELELVSAVVEIEGLYTAPHFIALDRASKPVAEKSWSEGTKLGHAGALEPSAAFCARGLPAIAWSASAIASCMEGSNTRGLSGWMPTSLQHWRSSCRLLPCINRTTWLRYGCCWSALPSCRR